MKLKTFIGVFRVIILLENKKKHIQYLTFNI